MVCVYVYVGVYVCVCVERSTLYLRQGLFLNGVLTNWLDWLTSKPHGSTCLPVTQPWDHRDKPPVLAFPGC